MTPALSEFRLIEDSVGNITPDSLSTFSLKTTAPTDLWRKPPSLDVSNAPTYTAGVKLGEFRRARVTVSAQWTRQYDQGGLVLLLPSKDKAPPRWVKTGIEFYNDRTNLSTVAADRAADWSLVPLRASNVVVEIEREEKAGVLGPGLWVYFYDEGKRHAVREITWVFDGSVADEEEVRVGAYVARPTADKNDEDGLLVVEFQDLVIE